MDYITTYTGEGEEPQAPKSSVYDAIKKQKIEGKTVEELVEEMYNSMDPNFVVAAAAALWVPSKGKWELAVKNKS